MDDKLTDTPSEGNVALSHLRDLLFGDYLSREGLTEIAINRPGELHTKINGAWEMHASPVTLRQCSSFAVALAVWNNDTIDETSPILSATLPTGERCQIVVPRPVSATPSQSPCVSRTTSSAPISRISMPGFMTGCRVQKRWNQKTGS